MGFINLFCALPPLEFHYGIALSRYFDMNFDFKWGLICFGQATDTILNNPNMLSHMEGTIWGIKYFFIKVQLLPLFPLTKIIVDKAQYFMNIFKQVSLNKCIHFIHSFLKKK